MGYTLAGCMIARVEHAGLVATLLQLKYRATLGVVVVVAAAAAVGLIKRHKNGKLVACVVGWLFGWRTI